jgi:molybdopterin synthase catalytic subunit
VGSLISIQEEDFSLDEVLKQLSKKGTGGIAFFLGVVRDGGEKKVDTIFVEAYLEAARKELERLRGEALGKYNLSEVVIIHRVGRIRVGENILLIGTSAPHRRDALRGCDYLINQLKVRIPIWKKEIGPTGESWVVNPPTASALLETQ